METSGARLWEGERTALAMVSGQPLELLGNLQKLFAHGFMGRGIGEGAAFPGHVLQLLDARPHRTLPPSPDGEPTLSRAARSLLCCKCGIRPCGAAW